jgi:thiamine biosynthesis protein ThiS
MITVFINGKARQINPLITIGSLVDGYKLPRNGVLVEVNLTALHRTEWPDRVLNHGDRVEIIRVVAGG